jgi:general secretion pathway protein C
VVVGAFAYQCLGLTAAIERLTEATRQSNAVALHRASSPTPASTPAPLPAPVPPLVLPPPIVQAIIPEGDTRYLVDRRLVDVVLEDQANLMRSVRVVPASANGKTYARLFGIRPDSLLGMLGFRDGDRLEAINGFDLSTPERALQAYARLRTADVLEARVRRGTQLVTLHYRLW